MKAFIFRVDDVEDVVIVSDSLEMAQAELRVWGILYCGGVTFKLKEELPC